MIFAWALSTALAADPTASAANLTASAANLTASAAYPYVGQLELPAAGVARIVLGPDAIGAAPEELGTSIRIEDATGRDVPYAVLTSDDPRAESAELTYSLGDARSWVIEASARPIDALEVRVDDLLSHGPYRASVEADGPGGWSRVGPPTLLYALSGDVRPHNRVSVPHGRGPFRLTLEPLGSDRAWLENVQGISSPSGSVSPVTEVVEAGPAVLTDEGRARYVLHLPGPRLVTGLRVDVGGDVFAREVQVGVPGELGSLEQGRTATIQRVHLGATNIDLVELDGLALRGDELLVDIALDRGRALPVTSFTVTSPGAELVVRDAGAGPHTLYVGSREEGQAYDLGVAALELLAQRPRVVPAPALGANPAYVPRPTREGVDAVGGPPTSMTFRWERAVTGPAGWVRVALDRTTLSHTAPGLADLRVLDRAGGQVPYVVRSTGVGVPMPTGPMKRTEEGRLSRIRVPLDDNDVPVDRVTLTTSADTFTRRITIVVDHGSMTETVRSVEWSGGEDGHTLTLDVGRPLGRELLLTIDNGDNPPLAVESVSVTTPTSAIAFRLPEGGARIAYGARNADRPSYDLSALADEVARMPLAAAVLGPETAVGAPELSFLDRLVVAGAVGFLAFGLLAMTIRVVRAAPPAGGSADRSADPSAGPAEAGPA